MSSFKFDWKANRNFCLTAKHSCDFECEEAEEARENDKFDEFALKLEHRFWHPSRGILQDTEVNLSGLQKSTFRLVGYYKTQKAAEEAMCNKTSFAEYAFIWNRNGECVDAAC